MFQFQRLSTCLRPNRINETWLLIIFRLQCFFPLNLLHLVLAEPWEHVTLPVQALACGNSGRLLDLGLFVVICIEPINLLVVALVLQFHFLIFVGLESFNVGVVDQVRLDEVVHLGLVERRRADLEEVLEALALAEAIQIENKWCSERPDRLRNLS